MPLAAAERDGRYPRKEAIQQRFDVGGVVVQRSARRGFYRLAEVGNALGVHAVGFGQLAHSASEVANLAGVDGKRNLRLKQSARQRSLVTACGLQGCAARFPLRHKLAQGAMAGRVILETSPNSCGPRGHIEGA